MTLDELMESSEIIVCCGSGGVGKTTTAGALALHGAGQGKRACVVTIDPAKRLADALGLGQLTNVPGRIDGPWPGELWALMLDTKGTFDDLVQRYSPSSEQADSIIANRLYRNISGALSGTQEYMAMEKLYELHHDGAPGTGPDDAAAHFDIIVVDTPPSRNALDFLDAPRRLTSFLDNRIFRLLVMPTRAYLKAVSVATQTLLRTISRVVGSEVVNDAINFFNAFEGMETGFRDRAEEVLELLRDERTGFVIVTSPRLDAIEEAAFFADRLGEGGIEVGALIVNRLHPQFLADGGADSLPAGSPPGPFANLVSNLDDFRRVSAREEDNFAALAAKVAPATVTRVPFFAEDVHDLDGLALVESHLFVEEGQ